MYDNLWWPVWVSELGQRYNNSPLVTEHFFINSLKFVIPLDGPQFINNRR